MPVTFAVSSIALAGGVTITPPKNGMTLFIGPNNSGKSLLLRELAPYVGNPTLLADTNRWVRSVSCDAEGTGEEFLAWLHERGYQPWYQEGDLRYHLAEGVDLPAGTARQWWDQRRLDSMRPALLCTQWTDNRLTVASQAGPWDYLIPGALPMQHLFRSRDAEKALSALTRQAFDVPVTVDRYSQVINLRVGETGMDDIPHGDAPQELYDAYRSLPLVSEQGDGFRSFVQLLLHTMLQPKPVVIIDEPGAFLHPPQARLLGRLLASLEGQSQVFVATHSADFLAGVLDAQTDRKICLVRLDRTTGAPTARALEPTSVKDLLRTPLLRYSNIISGLFHDRVVLCESEGDCQFYAATFDVTKDPAKPENALFLHTNGKPRLAETARRLRECGIPTAVIADLDLLRTSGDVRKAVTALGGAWEDVSTDFKVLNDHANESRTALTVAEFRKQMNDVLGRAGDSNPVPPEAAARIGDLLKTASGWKHLKKSGLSALNGTNAYAAAARLTTVLARLGVFLVPVGELESWIAGIPSGNKSAWLEKVFEEGHHLRPDTHLTQFCAQIRDHLDGLTRA
ncbi:AAA family ATPase [Streptomyces sp. ISL-43]|uniref:AAA family ATPase n=1 Tax=Streptomyces sp. ISL-43 TaxID=2819183 RepID=UPI001BE8F563|nr:AAA family ATPase [Streptomyces sp. ISL-43]MBT2452135.1 AAA family ATPase [Streptomyces sp. ISL-43]